MNLINRFFNGKAEAASKAIKDQQKTKILK